MNKRALRRAIGLCTALITVSLLLSGVPVGSTFAFFDGQTQNTGSVNWILVGATTQAYYGDGSCGTNNSNVGLGKSCDEDYFKLNGLSGSVPEPATFVLAGSALLGLGLLRRKKMLSNS